jgi:putative transcriptional regulator
MARSKPATFLGITALDVRRHLNLSQTQFSKKFGLPIGTLRNWEQGRTKPDSTSQFMLGMIYLYPEQAEALLNSPEKLDHLERRARDLKKPAAAKHKEGKKREEKK